jgi:hypothetical protein
VVAKVSCGRTFDVLDLQKCKHQLRLHFCSFIVAKVHKRGKWLVASGASPN